MVICDFYLFWPAIDFHNQLILLSQEETNKLSERKKNPQSDIHQGSKGLVKWLEKGKQSHHPQNQCVLEFQPGTTKYKNNVV